MSIPKLRFKGYRNNWGEKKLSEISKIRTGPFGSVLHEHDYVSTGTPIITVEHLGEGNIEHSNLPLVSDDDKERLKSYILKADDIVFSRVGSVDRSCLVSKEEDGWLFSGRLLRLRTFNNLASPSFLNQCLKTHLNKHRIRSVAVGQTMASLNTEILNNFTVQIPEELEEQEKISSFLSLVDKKISLLTQKHELLISYKKGVLQKVFNQEIRFKDVTGNDYPAWEEKILKNVARLKNGYAFKSSSYSKGAKYTIVTISNVQSGRMTLDRKNSLHSLPPDIRAHQILNKGDLLVSMTGNVGRICKVSIDNALLNQRVGVIHPESVSKNFLYHSLNREQFSKSMETISQGGAQKNIGTGDIENFVLHIPSLEEQERIPVLRNRSSC